MPTHVTDGLTQCLALDIGDVSRAKLTVLSALTLTTAEFQGARSTFYRTQEGVPAVITRVIHASKVARDSGE